MQTDELITEIVRAFAGVRLGHGVSLHEARALDDYEPPDVVTARRMLDAEEHWEDIPDAKIDAFADTLAFMDAEGFRFHIPRFMIWSLQHAESSDSLAVDAAIYACEFDVDARDHALTKYELLTADHRRVIARFLQHVAMEKNGHQDAAVAERALESYWRAFLAE